MSCLPIFTVALALLFGVAQGFAQPRAYVPLSYRDTTTLEGKQFTWTKTAQSAHFFLIWGDTVGTNPTAFANPDLRFDPQSVLDTLEFIHARCDEIGMIDHAPTSLAQRYKYVVIMYGTFGAAGPQGWANGWAVDDSIGAFWVHPNATRDGGVMAHEFTHSLQAMYHLDGRNTWRGGNAIYTNDGLFYETHANYVRNVIYPRFVTADIDAHHNLMLEPDWKFNYEGYAFLLHIHHTLGGAMVSRLWTEWRPLEFPLQTLRRLSGMTQSAFNSYMFDYACRNVTWDYPLNDWGTVLRASRRERRSASWGRQFAQRTYDVLRAIDTAARRYYSPAYMAPQDYGYNVIPLYPDDRTQPITVAFRGHPEVNDHAGWRYGFVTELADGTVGRKVGKDSVERATLSITLRDDEARVYLVVMGAPVDSMHADPDVHNTWHGNPKRFRYPYEITVRNARPEGFQSPELVQTVLRTAPGHRHANGGGWVDDAASVASEVYVGPRALVLGTSAITGRARIDGCAIVENAVIGDRAVVTDNAVVRGGKMSDSAIVADRCFADNNVLSGAARLGGSAMVSNYHLGGVVEIDGDLVVYNDTGRCNTGYYAVLTQYYRNDPLPCGERDRDHPENQDVNRPMIFDTVTSVLDDVITSTGVASACIRVGTSVQVNAHTEGGKVVSVVIMSMLGEEMQRESYIANDVGVVTLPTRSLPIGWYGVSVRSSEGSFAYVLVIAE